MINEDVMTLLNDYCGQDISGWYVSEKYDGCRAYWDGKAFWTRGGNVIDAPDWFKEGLPQQHLDGEIWAGYGKFQEARVAVQFGKFTPDICFIVFDAPQISGNWGTRIEAARMLIPCASYAEIIRYWQTSDVASDFIEIKLRGGEGVVVRNPAVEYYEQGRSKNVLRIKKNIDGYPLIEKTNSWHSESIPPPFPEPPDAVNLELLAAITRCVEDYFNRHAIFGSPRSDILRVGICDVLGPQLVIEGPMINHKNQMMITSK